MKFIIKELKNISYYQILSRNRRYKTKKGKEWIANFQEQVKKQMLENGWELLDCKNIECEIILYHDNKRKHDLDNNKQILDALEGIVYNDDNHITRLIYEKHYQKPCECNLIITIKSRDC